MGEIKLTDVRLVYVSIPPDDAAEMARKVVDEGLAACVNILPAVRSVYSWQGITEDEIESLLLIKTTAPRLPELQFRVRELHSYDEPEFVAVEIAAGSDSYLQWVRDSVAVKPRS